MAIGIKPKSYICTEAFCATLRDGDHWYKAGQEVRAEDEVFDGESGKNRQKRLFIPKDSE